MKPATVRASKALGITASLMGAVAGNAEAASVDAAPGFFFSTLPFNDNGTTVGANNDISLLPEGVSDYTRVEGPDVFYSFVVVTPGTMTFTVTPTDGPEWGYDPAIYLLTGGTTGPNAFIGKDANSYNAPESLTTPILAAGTYYFVIDSFYSTRNASQSNWMHGAYALSISGTAELGAIPEPGIPALGATVAGIAAWRRRRRGTC